MQRRFATAAAAQNAVFTPVQLKHLPYEMGALEPIISGQLLDFHYSKHHRAYVNNLNQLME